MPGLEAAVEVAYGVSALSQQPGSSVAALANRTTHHEVALRQLVETLAELIEWQVDGTGDCRGGELGRTPDIDEVGSCVQRCAELVPLHR